MNSKKNIIDIHNSIIQIFKQEKELLPVLERRFKELRYMYNNDIFSDDIREKISNEINEISERCDKIKSKQNLHFYLLQSTRLLEEYKKELEKPIEMNFMGIPTSVHNVRKDELTRKFMNLVQKTFPNKFNHISITPNNSTCLTCDRKNTFDKIIDSTNTIACSYCGTEKDVLQSTFSYKDTDRINITSKYQYDRRVHFRECINQFQGKQNSTIRQEVYDKVIEQLHLHGLVRDGDLPQKIKYDQVTKYHIYIFLKETGYANHYEDLNLIYHTITGNELDDISYLEDVLMEDFDKLSQLYDEEYIKTKKITRKNFINTQYVLYQLLKRHKYPCVRTDFTFLKTIERKGFHDDICSDLFKKLKWNFTQCF
jgi:hypothetical protein